MDICKTSLLKIGGYVKLTCIEFLELVKNSCKFFYNQLVVRFCTTNFLCRISHKFHTIFQQYVLTIAKNGYNIYAVQQTRTKSAKIYKELEGENVLDDRKKQILQAIIEEYINTAEPVSSGALVQKYNLDYSSATIRMKWQTQKKVVTQINHILQVGRVPSAKGYRLYVDELLKDDDISLEEIKYIQSKLETRVNEIEELTKIATNTLSEVTHYTSVAIGPRTNLQNIEEVKFVLLGTRMLMAVILTDTGIIKETIIKFDEDITEDQVNTLNFIFNNKLKGKPIEEIDKPLEEYIFSEMNYSLNVIKPIMQQLDKVINEEAKVYLEGTNKVFELPEFKSLEVAKNFVNLIDTKQVMLDLLNTGFAKDINVYIGDENENEQLKDFSIITFKHRYQDKDLGTIGIIGPKRMDYSKVISVMKYISKKLNGQ